MGEFPSNPDDKEPMPAGIEAIGLKEALAMIEELDADDAELADALEQALMTPVPELGDEAAKEEYRSNMELIRDAARRLAHNTERNAYIRAKINERIAELYQGT